MSKDIQLLAAAAEFSLDSIMITDNDLEQGPFIVYVNSAFTRLTGYRGEEVIGQTPRLLQGDKTDPAVLEGLKEQLAKGESFCGRTVNYRKDGKEFLNEWHVEPIPGCDGTIKHYLSIQRDISGVCVSKEDLLAQNFDLQEKIEALTALLKQTEEENTRIKDTVAANIKDVIFPFFKRLRRQGARLDKDKLDRMQERLVGLTANFGIQASEGEVSLSPREVEISGLIKSGASTKEISKALNLSAKTVETHRNRIRRKLGLLNKSVNLTTYLQNQ